MTRSHDKERRRRHRQQGRTAHRRRHEHGDEQDNLTREIAASLATGHPLDLMAQVSALVEVLDERQAVGEPGPPRAEFLAALAGMDSLETTALLTVWQHLTPLELERRTIGRALASRRHPLPEWLVRLDDVAVARVLVTRDGMGEAAQYLIEVVWPDGTPLTLAALVQADDEDALVDALVLDAPLEALADLVEEIGGLGLADADPADARASVERAIERTAALDPPIETDSWPMIRPLLEWALRLLPEGGTAQPVTADLPGAVLTQLAGSVGGRYVLDALDAAPLPDEPFDWAGIPAAVRAKVGAALAVFDATVDVHADVEFRTAGRRLLAEVARSRPEIFRRPASDATAACAVAVLVAEANQVGVPQKAIAEWFGLSAAPGSRLTTFRNAVRAVGWVGPHGGVVQAGLLTSDARRLLIEMRDYWRAQQG